MTGQKRFLRPELFSNDEQRKEALRYITVQDAIPQQDAFYALPLQIAFEPIYLSDSAADQAEKATMVYAVDDWMMLPTLFSSLTRRGACILLGVSTRLTNGLLFLIGSKVDFQQIFQRQRFIDGLFYDDLSQFKRSVGKRFYAYRQAAQAAVFSDDLRS